MTEERDAVINAQTHCLTMMRQITAIGGEPRRPLPWDDWLTYQARLTLQLQDEQERQVGDERLPNIL